MPGKTRVSSLAKQLGITSREALAKLNDMGEYVKSASSTVEAPVARRLRDRCVNASGVAARNVSPQVARRTYPKNNPYSDLGQVEENAITNASPSPQPHRVSTPASFPDRVPRRGVHRGDVAELDRILLRHMIRANPLRRAPRPPELYWASEVDEAGERSNAWAYAMLDANFDFEDIDDWCDALGVFVEPMSGRDPAEVAVRLSLAGVTPDEMRSWRYEDGKSKNLGFRLMVGNIDVEQTIVMVEERRQQSA